MEELGQVNELMLVVERDRMWLANLALRTWGNSCSSKKVEQIHCA